MARTSDSECEAIPLVPVRDASGWPANWAEPSWLGAQNLAMMISNLVAPFALTLAATVAFWLILLGGTLSQSNQDSITLPKAKAAMVARTLNGSYRGLQIDGLGQYAWLGMPYALPPVEELRFRRPQPLKETWEGVRDATEYGPHCPAYGDHEAPFRHSEDCLTVNVIRPMKCTAGVGTALPVGVFIHGGMNHGGGTSDPRYNLSFIVHTACEAGLPFIGVSINYRSSMWGFIHSRQVLGEGSTNLGLHDQRLALRWVHENINGFGGDRNLVTIWGGSSGADDVGFHLLAYGGRDEGLFRGAIMQSGSAITKTANSIDDLQDMYDDLILQAGCAEAEDGLDCLRTLSYEELRGVFTENDDGMSPRMRAFSMVAIDGDLVPTYSSLALQEGRMVRVPILTGVTSNEGSTWIPHNVRVWEDEREHLIHDLDVPAPIAARLMGLYPEVAKSQNDTLSPPIKSIASLAEFQRIERLEGDLNMNAADRFQCEAYTDSGAGCYSYRFNAPIPMRVDSRLGVVHAAEIGPVLQNVGGGGFFINPFSGMNDNDEFRNMAKVMGIMWAGFIVSLDPNVGFANPTTTMGENVQQWPRFSREKRERMVFNSTGVWVEQDFARLEAMEYINRIQAGILQQ